MQLNQKKKLGEELLHLRPNVTSGDRKELVAEFGIAISTVSKYLSGDVHDPDIAIKILKYLKEKINEREMKISVLMH